MVRLVRYDVNTVNAAGRRRLRRIAKVCEDWGVRVQNSVFECSVDWAQWVALKAKLEGICEPTVDSLRCYILGDNDRLAVVHFCAMSTVDPVEYALIV